LSKGKVEGFLLRMKIGRFKDEEKNFFKNIAQNPFSCPRGR